MRVRFLANLLGRPSRSQITCKLPLDSSRSVTGPATWSVRNDSFRPLQYSPAVHQQTSLRVRAMHVSPTSLPMHSSYSCSVSSGGHGRLQTQGLSPWLRSGFSFRPTLKLPAPRGSLQQRLLQAWSCIILEWFCLQYLFVPLPVSFHRLCTSLLIRPDHCPVLTGNEDHILRCPAQRLFYLTTLSPNSKPPACLCRGAIGSVNTSH